MVRKVKKSGLVGDLWPHIRLMRLTGMWILEFYDDNSLPLRFFRIVYCITSSSVLLVQYLAILAFLFLDCFTGDQMASGTVTLLFFTHCIVKHVYFGVMYNRFSRLFKWWDQHNSHPLFMESNNRQRATACMRMRKLLMMVVIGTLVAIMAWTVSSFLSSQTREMPEAGTNHTIIVRFPHLLFGAHGFYSFTEGWPYIISFLLQFWFLSIGLLHSNILDTLFCCYVIFACEQLKHLKEVMKPIMELSGALIQNPNVQDIFQANASNQDNSIYENEELRSGSFVRDEIMPQSNILQQNGSVTKLTKRQEIFVRSAIKYWVERHKHVVRFVNYIGTAYGGALLLHMLTSTVTLTLLAYQATKIDSIDMYAVSVCGYLFYTLGQVFLFCIHGNELIEESTSVMEAAYACHWYDGSEEAKTFVQIVCQQCQKSLTISGAKFFTISLDLFASVLGAVVTYFMVLIQLK